MNGGKDVKIGHDKRPVSVIPSDEQPLYNIANGELLTDEFGNQLITKVDQFFLADASKERATSVVFPENPEDKYNIKTVTQVGVSTATYGADFDADVQIINNKIEVLKKTGAVVAVGSSAKQMIPRTLSLSTGGSGYTAASNVATTGGGSGTGLTVNITVSGGAVNGVTINTAGSSYITGDTITIIGGNNDATFTISALVATETIFTDLNQCEIRTRESNVGTFNDKNNLYFPESDVSYLANVGVGISFKVSGANIPAKSYVVKKDFNRIKISEPVTAGLTNDKVTFFNSDTAIYTADNVLKVAEEFRETSEVSTTLLGVNRAETQLSLFSNVSSYGLNSDEWESFSYNSGASKASWDNRPNKIYGNRYLARIEEETQESAIKLSAFPPSHSYPFGPNYAKLGLYNETLFQQYINFIRLGNLAYELFSTKLSGYSADWTSKFLNPNDVDFNESNGQIVYTKLPGKEDDFSYAFSKIDEWTDTWRAIGEGKSLKNPVTGEFLNFGILSDLLGANGLTSIYDGSNTRPGYSTDYRRYAAIQSRRVFRYQPGRISGFTFGLRSSVEPVSGIALEWGIANATDQYVFKIYAGQLSIVRRSTVPLSTEVLVRNGLDPAKTTSIQINGTSYNTVQPQIPSGDPFDVNDDGGPLGYGTDDTRALKFHTIEIPRDKFNGDPLNGNGPSGYTIRPENVTMWKIEFGWYGAIGARFYAYIPSGAGEARWIVIHTLVIENQLGQPCLQDSYFRFKYSLDVFNTANLKTPQFLYKYGASYYIDGGDEGTSQIYSVSSGLSPKQINAANETSLFAVRPKDAIISQITRPSGEDQAVAIKNRKLILPTKFNISTNALTEVKVKTCKACAGFGHVFTPGVATTETGRNMTVEFISGNLITAVGTGASFTSADIGAKLIAPSIFNAYITEMDEGGTVTEYPNGFKTYESAKVYGWGPGLDGYPGFNKIGGTSGRPIGGTEVFDYATGITTTVPVGIGNTYPHLVRLSNYDVHFASDFPLTGAEIDIQFMNPRNKDQSSLGGSGTHFADFMIGVTDKKPSVNTGDPNILDGWDPLEVPWTDYSNLDGSPIVGTSKTTILPEKEILFGEHTHSHATMNEDGIETSEAWSNSSYKCRMGQDVRIPVVGGTSGGACSIIKINVSNPVGLGTVNQEYLTGTLPSGITTTTIRPRYFLTVEGSFGGGVTDWLDGQVVYLNDNDGSVNDTSNAKYLDMTPTSYIDGGTAKQYIEISTNVKPSGFQQSDSNIKIVGRPVQLKTSRQGVSTKTKLFKYDVYPLYLVGKLMDRAQINNISVTERTGTFQRTTAPILSISKDSNGVIDLANDGSGALTINDNTPPTNFVSIDRLSSSTVDTQNEHVIRPSITKDIFFIGADSTKEIDMTKVFGIDRNVITPDNNNIEATFITAKSLSGSSSKFVQSSLNFKEQ